MYCCGARMALLHAGMRPTVRSGACVHAPCNLGEAFWRIWSPCTSTSSGRHTYQCISHLNDARAMCQAELDESLATMQRHRRTCAARRIQRAWRAHKPGKAGTPKRKGSGKAARKGSGRAKRGSAAAAGAKPGPAKAAGSKPAGSKSAGGKSGKPQKR